MEHSFVSVRGTIDRWRRLTIPNSRPPFSNLFWRASTLRQMALSGTPARYNKSFQLIRQYSLTFATVHVASSTSAAVASRKYWHIFIRFSLQLINLIVFYSYIKSIKCIIRFIRAVIKDCKKLKCTFMYFVLFFKYIHLWVFCILFGFNLFIIDNLQIYS